MGRGDLASTSACRGFWKHYTIRGANMNCVPLLQPSYTLWEIPLQYCRCSLTRRNNTVIRARGAHNLQMPAHEYFTTL